MNHLTSFFFICSIHVVFIKVFPGQPATARLPAAPLQCIRVIFERVGINNNRGGVSRVYWFQNSVCGCWQFCIRLRGFIRFSGSCVLPHPYSGVDGISDHICSAISNLPSNAARMKLRAASILFFCTVLFVFSVFTGSGRRRKRHKK